MPAHPRRFSGLASGRSNLRSHIFVHRGAASAGIPGQQPETGTVNPYFGLPPAGAPGTRLAAMPGDNLSARTLLATATHLANGVVTLAFTNFLDAYSDVTVQVAMIGGTISYVTEQIEMAAEESGSGLSKTLKKVYLDTGQSGRGPRGIALAAKVFGAEVSEADKTMIFSGNARRLLTLKGVDLAAA